MNLATPIPVVSDPGTELGLEAACRAAVDAGGHLYDGPEAGGGPDLRLVGRSCQTRLTRDWTWLDQASRSSPFASPTSRPTKTIPTATEKSKTSPPSFEAGLMAISCAWIIWEAIQRIRHNTFELRYSMWPVLVLLTSIAVDFWRSRELRRVAERTGSPALATDAFHFASDIWASLAVLAGPAGYMGRSCFSH